MATLFAALAAPARTVLEAVRGEDVTIEPIGAAAASHGVNGRRGPDQSRPVVTITAIVTQEPAMLQVGEGADTRSDQRVRAGGQNVTATIRLADLPYVPKNNDRLVRLSTSAVYSIVGPVEEDGHGHALLRLVLSQD